MVTSAPPNVAGARPRARRRWWTWAVSLLVPAGLLTFLVTQVDANAFAAKLAQVSPGYAVLAVTLFLGNLVICGLRLRHLAQASGERYGRLAWIRLSALHQALFTVLPSGVADFGFPALAARLVGCGTASATRVLLTYRIQDFWAVMILAGTGLYWRAAGTMIDLALLSCGLVAAACLMWSSDLTRLLVSAVLGVVKLGGGRWSRKFRILTAPTLQILVQEMRRPTSWGQRVQGATMTLLSWSLSAASLWSLFAMIDMQLGLADILLVIAGMNIVGAVAAFTVAGLGVGEGGLAAILVALGFGAADALAAALIVRPASVLKSLLGCALVEITFRLVRGLTRPSS